MYVISVKMYLTCPSRIINLIKNWITSLILTLGHFDYSNQRLGHDAKKKHSATDLAIIHVSAPIIFSHESSPYYL